MSANYSKLATASTITTEHMLDAEDAVRAIKRALADGLQPHDVSEILAACVTVENRVGGIREQMAIVADVEMDIDVIRRIATAGRENVWSSQRYRDRDRRVREAQAKAPTKLHFDEANEAA